MSAGAAKRETAYTEVDPPREGSSVLPSAEQAEAFQLGAVLARIETNGTHTAEGVKQIGADVTQVKNSVGEIQVRQGEQAEQIKTLFSAVTVLQQKDDGDRKEFATKAELNDAKTSLAGSITELKTEVAASRLSWPKLITGVGILAGTLIAGLGFLAQIGLLGGV